MWFEIKGFVGVWSVIHLMWDRVFLEIDSIEHIKLISSDQIRIISYNIISLNSKPKSCKHIGYLNEEKMLPIFGRIRNEK